MKKLILNISAIVFGVLASITCFLPMFDACMVTGLFTSYANEPFGLFSQVNEMVALEFEFAGGELKTAFKVIAAILAVIAVICVVYLIVNFVLNLLNKKVKVFAKLNKFVAIALIALAVLILGSTLIYLISSSVEYMGGTIKLTIINYFAYIATIVGFAGAGVCTFFAKDGKKKK